MVVVVVVGGGCGGWGVLVCMVVCAWFVKTGYAEVSMHVLLAALTESFGLRRFGLGTTPMISLHAAVGSAVSKHGCGTVGLVIASTLNCLGEFVCGPACGLVVW